MTIATVIDRGIGPDGTPSAIILRGLSTAPTTASIVTRGYLGTPTGVILRGFTPVAATQSATVCDSTSWTGYSLQEDQIPAVEVGDIFYVDLVTTPGGYAVTVNGDGTVSIEAGGDTTRQRFQADIFDTSLASNYGAFTVYVNNHAPQINVQPDDVAVIVNNAMTTLQMTDYVIDQDGDAMTLTKATGTLPTGVSIVGTALQGTPTTAVDNAVTLRMADVTGEYVDVTINYLSDPGVTVPNVVGTTAADAVASIAGAGLVPGDFSPGSYSVLVPAGSVLSQSPAGGFIAFTGSTVELALSLGEELSGAVLPSVVGLDSVTAGGILSELGLTVEVVSVQSISPLGEVIEQSPAANAEISLTQVITLYASTGPAVAGNKAHITVKPRRRHTNIRR